MSYVVQFDLSRAPELKAKLLEQGFTLAQPPYTFFQGKKTGVTCTLYTSGKLMVQGRAMKEFIEFFLEPEVLHTFSFGYEDAQSDQTPHIGVDESGKGDYFGPLCVAAVYADEPGIAQLSKIGVKDSKKLKDPAILKIAEKIQKNFPYHIVKIGPEKYNELYEKFSNLNLLLGWGHATAISDLLERTDCTRVIIDQFAAEHVVENALKQKNKEATLIQRPRAELDIVVAAASILARAAFVKGIEDLEKQMNITLPKGANATIITTGKKLVKVYGPSILAKVGKLHFKTTDMILSSS